MILIAKMVKKAIHKMELRFRVPWQRFPPVEKRGGGGGGARVESVR